MFVTRARRWTACLALLGAGAAAPACGGRSGLSFGPPLEEAPACVVDADCPGYDDFCKPMGCQLVQIGPDEVALIDIPPVAKCVPLPETDCDDNDPCTTDVCDSALRQCRYSHATLDSDGDGHYAARPGFRPGEPGACGDDWARAWAWDAWAWATA